MPHTFTRLFPIVLLIACRAARPSEVLVLGMLHDGHTTSKTFGVDVVQDIVRNLDPDFILIEVPPERMDAALSGYRETGELTEPRASRFVEYREAIFPLLATEDFELIGCAGWTKAMADARSAKLDGWKTTRPAMSAEVKAAQDDANDAHRSEGLEDFLGIHTARYDEIVKAGMEPYDRHFNDELGLGGWTNINAAHYAHIATALDEHRGQGKRFLVTFGAWHKYWILEQLRKRDDVVLLDAVDFATPRP